MHDCPHVRTALTELAELKDYVIIIWEETCIRCARCVMKITYVNIHNAFKYKTPSYRLMDATRQSSILSVTAGKGSTVFP